MSGWTGWPSAHRLPTPFFGPAPVLFYPAPHTAASKLTWHWHWLRVCCIDLKPLLGQRACATVAIWCCHKPLSCAVNSGVHQVRAGVRAHGVPATLLRFQMQVNLSEAWWPSTGACVNLLTGSVQVLGPKGRCVAGWRAALNSRLQVVRVYPKREHHLHDQSTENSNAGLGLCPKP